MSFFRTVSLVVAEERPSLLRERRQSLSIVTIRTKMNGLKHRRDLFLTDLVYALRHSIGDVALAMLNQMLPKYQQHEIALAQLRRELQRGELVKQDFKIFSKADVQQLTITILVEEEKPLQMKPRRARGKRQT